MDWWFIPTIYGKFGDGLRFTTSLLTLAIFILSLCVHLHLWSWRELKQLAIKNLQGDHGRCRYHSQGSALVNHTAHAHGPCSPGWCFKYGGFLEMGDPLKIMCFNTNMSCFRMIWGCPALRKPPYVLEETSHDQSVHLPMASVCLKMGVSLLKWPVKSEENDDYSFFWGYSHWIPSTVPWPKLGLNDVRLP